MTSFRAIAMLTLAFAALSVADKASPVQKVLGMIDSMSAKSKEHVAASVKEFEEFAAFCNKGATEKEYSLKSSADAINSLEAVIEKSKANIGQCEEEVADMSTRIAATNGEAHKATTLREKEHADFLGLEKELSEAVGTLAKIGNPNAASFAQLPKDEHDQVDAVVGSLRSVVEAGFLTHEQRKKVASFLEAQDDANDDLETKANAEKKDGQGNVMQGVKDMAMGTLSDTRKKEQYSAFEHSTAMQTLNAEVKSMQNEMSSSQQNKQYHIQALAQAEKDLAVEKKARAEDVKFLDDLKLDCNSKFSDFEADYKEAQAELKALAQARNILANGVKASFLETHASLHVAVQNSEPDGKTRALRFINQLGKRLKITALVSLSYRAAADPFGKIRGMVEDMIAKLQQEAAEEATQEKFCQEEQGKSLKSKDKKELVLEKTDSRIEKSQSSIARLAEDVESLSKELADLDAEITEATHIRTEEKAAFSKTEGDLVASVAACQEAVTVLRANAEGAASLLQKDSQTRSSTVTKAKVGLKGVDGIIQMLDYAQSDFAQQLASARSAESMAATEYQKLTTESRLVKSTKEVEIKGKQSESMSLKTGLASYTEDKDSVSTELSAVNGYLAELKPKCEADKPPSYAQRKAARDQEIQGLKDALKLLE